MPDHRPFRANVLTAYGATPSEVEELLGYNHNVFDRAFLSQPLQFPLPSELHIAVWQEYAAAAQSEGAFSVLRQHLVQLRFPIQAGISKTIAYQAATRRGTAVDQMPEASGLRLRNSQALELSIHYSIAGAIPVLYTPDRADFVALVQALSLRNEPQSIPESMGACTVKGLNNWDRIRRDRQAWEAQNPGSSSEDWAAEFQRILPQKERYQDQFILLSSGAYSGVSAAALGLSPQAWQEISRTIRLEHECTHYLTYRLFNAMQNNLLDELIADYCGIVAAIGHYRADWFLRFLGLEAFPAYRNGGRLQIYRGQPPLSDRSFQILQALVKAAAENLEQFDLRYGSQFRSPIDRLWLVMGLTNLTLEELASAEMISRIQTTLAEMRSAFNSEPINVQNLPTLTHTHS